MINDFKELHENKWFSDQEMALSIKTDHIEIFFKDESFIIDETPKEIWIRQLLAEPKGLKRYRFIRKIKK